ncbi:MAG TPA: YceI family protein [Rickettsiales bacterium]|nr:YceI family protein [Rickettsiales bacterium]
MKILFFTLIFFPLFSYAKTWKIVENESKIEFVATQNNSKITGSFKKFAGKIIFDKNNLANSNVDLNIDISSLETSLDEARETLKTKDWFDLTNFKNANFKTTKFQKISDKEFQADAKLTIKGIAANIVIYFSFDEYNKNRAKASGRAIIKRYDYNIGAKNLQNAHGVANDVVINFTLSAI